MTSLKERVARAIALALNEDYIEDAYHFDKMADAAIAECFSWQPIASAPRDGTFVLAVGQGGFVNILQWCQDQYWRNRVDSPPGRWSPTHWMPVPAPPPGEKIGGEG